VTDQVKAALRKTDLERGEVDRLYEWVNRECLPVLRALRASVNRRWGAVVTTAAARTMVGIGTDGADEMVFCSTASETITLPGASTRKGPVYVVNTSGGGTVTVAGNGSELVDGAASVTVSAGQGFISDGDAWWSV